MSDTTQYVKNILLRPTDRDKQRKVGASNLVNACTRCLADDFLGNSREQGTYNMGAIVGTAVHKYLEDRNMDPDAHQELKVTLGHIRNYGTVTARLDLYLPRQGLVVDFKTSTRDKIEDYKKVLDNGSEDGFDTDGMAQARYKMEAYVRQATLYAWGLAQRGFPVEDVAIVFIARDGQIVDRDVWGLTVPYSKETALNVWSRGEALWEWLQETDNKPEDLPSHDECYYCNQVRPYIDKKVTL